MRTNIKVRRRGYSLTVVLLFLVLLLGLWAAVYRTTASFLRVEMARVERDDLDSGVLCALGQALMYLENCPTPQVPGTYGIRVPPGASSDPNFTATFSRVTIPPNGTPGWSVQVTPRPYPIPLPGCP